MTLDTDCPGRSSLEMWHTSRRGGSPGSPTTWDKRGAIVAKGSASIVIQRPPTDVFSVLADVTKNSRWASASIEGRLTSAGPVAVGTTAREVTRFLGRRIETDSVVTEFIPDRRLAYVTRSGPFPFAGSFDVEPEAGGSCVTATFEAAPTGMFRLLGPVFASLATRQFERDLGSLKRRMEAHEL